MADNLKDPTKSPLTNSPAPVSVETDAGKRRRDASRDQAGFPTIPMKSGTPEAPSVIR